MTRTRTQTTFELFFVLFIFFFEICHIEFSVEAAISLSTAYISILKFWKLFLKTFFRLLEKNPDFSVEKILKLVWEKIVLNLV